MHNLVEDVINSCSCLFASAISPCCVMIPACILLICWFRLCASSGIPLLFDTSLFDTSQVPMLSSGLVTIDRPGAALRLLLFNFFRLNQAEQGPARRRFYLVPGSQDV